jgi:retinol dehydrogenase-12
MAMLRFMSQFLYSQFFVTPPYPTYDFTGQTVIVTGSNTGLGLEAARHFARLNCAKIILAVRTKSKGEKAKESILASTKRTSDCIEVWDLDLSSTASVKAFATRAQLLDRLDVLVENAGLLSPATCTLTAEGAEITVQTNVISTFLLALLLLPKLRETAAMLKTVPHLVIVTSEMHHAAVFKERYKEDIYAELSNEMAYVESGRDRYACHQRIHSAGIIYRRTR